MKNKFNKDITRELESLGVLHLNNPERNIPTLIERGISKDALSVLIKNSLTKEQILKMELFKAWFFSGNMGTVPFSILPMNAPQINTFSILNTNGYNGPEYSEDNLYFSDEILEGLLLNEGKWYPGGENLTEYTSDGGPEYLTYTSTFEKNVTDALAYMSKNMGDFLEFGFSQGGDELRRDDVRINFNIGMKERNLTPKEESTLVEIGVEAKKKEALIAEKRTLAKKKALARQEKDEKRKTNAKISTDKFMNVVENASVPNTLAAYPFLNNIKLGDRLTLPDTLSYNDAWIYNPDNNRKAEYTEWYVKSVDFFGKDSLPTLSVSSKKGSTHSTMSMDAETWHVALDLGIDIPFTKTNISTNMQIPIVVPAILNDEIIEKIITEGNKLGEVILDVQRSENQTIFICDPFFEPYSEDCLSTPKEAIESLVFTIDDISLANKDINTIPSTLLSHTEDVTLLKR